ncbi:hypothetical protein EMIHUDRAFT_113633 [Emiliania huxleyi CCMP1516]|uniref:Centrosomal protein of 162 kDa n=2 Tax=Emiliania huxleyi TaxID=2903 RepID=A0A0D3K1U5_EMIH1|nr:hypothetical protein EMIHUDRAFT_113633 [Emiliania huxleyi CCMP1516]EOD29730.1 hypothetical protein EMIHUDRAFT_113633 [Emiliania huxleyi CCMP1516]|eukprot:XP_005782159.1 hypothetical protein EMIHUDRAFT_113633 [Emiliania huxleyi CCMP1516]
MAEQAALERLLADLRSPIDESALSESFSDVGLEDLLVAAAAGDGGSDGDREEGGGEDLPVSGRVVASLQAENASLRRRAKLAAAQAQADLQTYRATAEAAQARTRDEVTSLREALLAVQVEMPKLRDRLVASKQEFASLRISAEQYRAIADEQTSVVQWVQARAERPLGELRGQATAAAVAQTGIAAQLQAEGGARVAAESSVRQLKTEVHGLREELNAARLKLAAERAAAAERDAEHAAALAEAAVVASAAGAGAGGAVAAQEPEAVVAARAYLAGRLEVASERLLQTEAVLARRDSDLASMQAGGGDGEGAAKEAAEARLAAAAAEHAESCSSRVAEEAAKWEKAAAAAAAAAESAHQATMAPLREGRDLAVADAAAWRARYDALQQQHNEHTAASAEQISSSHAALVDARAELKLRNFEQERLQARRHLRRRHTAGAHPCAAPSRLEQAAALQQRESLAADAARAGERSEARKLSSQRTPARRRSVAAPQAREKLELLKHEYYGLQASSGEAAAELRDARARLREYDRLEGELDQSVLQTGAAALGGVLTPPAVRVPASAEARLKQRVADELRATLAAREAEIGDLRRGIEQARRRTQFAASPQTFLIDKIEAAEGGAREAEARAAAAAQEAADRKAALDAAHEQQKLLQGDLERLLRQRGSIDSLRTTLARLL